MNNNDIHKNKYEQTPIKHINSITNPFIKDIPRLRNKLNLAVFASGNGSNFEAISRAISDNYLNAEISVLIVNNENCNAINRAKKLGIEFRLIDHRKYNSRESHELEILKVLSEYHIEAIIMAGWMRIVTSRLIEAYPGKIINIHPSLLPSFKGTNAINKALDSGTKITGCTVHKVIKDIDSGEIIAQTAVLIDPLDNLASLTSKIQEKEHELLPFAIAIAAKKWREK
tara:strand:- start:182 stop:865 length:684 start_codon:yes stop_codon:yes gene_type:complete